MIVLLALAASSFAQTAPQIDWNKINSEALDDFRTCRLGNIRGIIGAIVCHDQQAVAAV